MEDSSKPMRNLIFILFIPFLTTGNTFPLTGANDAGIGATSWVNPTNILSDNNATSTNNAGASSQYLVAKNFAFTVPAGATIAGITVRIAATESSGGTENVNARLQNATGVLIGDTKQTTWNGTTEAIYTYGGSADGWNASLTPSIVNDADFGVRFWYTTAHRVTVDYVTVAVEYTVGSRNFFQFFDSK
jgi:hypothetical protein